MFKNARESSCIPARSSTHMFCTHMFYNSQLVDQPSWRLDTVTLAHVTLIVQVQVQRSKIPQYCTTAWTSCPKRPMCRAIVTTRSCVSRALPLALVCTVNGARTFSLDESVAAEDGCLHTIHRAPSFRCRHAFEPDGLALVTEGRNPMQSRFQVDLHGTYCFLLQDER